MPNNNAKYRAKYSNSRIGNQRGAVEEAILALLDRLFEERAFDGKMLFLSQGDMTGRMLLATERIPVAVLDDIIAALEDVSLGAAKRIAVRMREVL